MKRIVRLTESDLARIVKRVISEQTTPPMVDAGLNSDSQNYAILLSQPTVTPGSGYKASTKTFVTAQVKFNGMIIKSTDGEVIQKGNIVLYAGCGESKTTSPNPAALASSASSNVFEGGSLYVFGKGGAVDKAVRAFCASKGEPSSELAGGNINPKGYINMATKLMSKTA